jgi:hypothetical protein
MLKLVKFPIFLFLVCTGKLEKWTNGSSWSEAGSLCHSVENMGFVAHDKNIYLFGGKNNDEVVTNTVQCYDTSTETCTIASKSVQFFI